MRLLWVPFTNVYKPLLFSTVTCLSCVGCASAPVKSTDNLGLESIAENTVKTSGVGIETNFMTEMFAGQVVYRPKGAEVRPVTHVRVYRQDPRRSAPYPVAFSIDRDGRLSERTTLHE